MSKRVWAMSSGVYSDYRVHAVFTSKAAAEKAAKLNESDRPYGEEGRVEEFELFDECPTHQTVFKVDCYLFEDGTTKFDEEVETMLPWNHWEKPYLNGRARLKKRDWRTTHNEPRRHMFVWAYGWTHESAMKAVADRVAMEKAKLEGVA